MTIDAVRDRSKTVTRRRVDTWKDLKRGDRLTLIEKGMGLPKGARQVVLCEVEVVDVRVEWLDLIMRESAGTRREGLGHMTAYKFARFWADSHGYKKRSLLTVMCRRIEWRYLEAER